MSISEIITNVVKSRLEAAAAEAAALLSKEVAQVAAWALKEGMTETEVVGHYIEHAASSLYESIVGLFPHHKGMVSDIVQINANIDYAQKTMAALQAANAARDAQSQACATHPGSCDGKGLGCCPIAVNLEAQHEAEQKA